MRASDEARAAVGLLLVLQLLTSLGGVVLLGRMSPAVDRILTENVYSTEAVEQMLASVAQESGGAGFDPALARAKSNITEPEEHALLAHIEAIAPAALAGDPAARADVVASLRALGEVNRASMRRADAHATRLGLGGAWAMALLGFAGFLGSWAVRQRIEARLLAPVMEVSEVLEAARAGDGFRRCLATGDSDAARLKESVNWLLERRAPPPAASGREAELRDALLSVLDSLSPGPSVLFDAAGQVVAASAATFARGISPAEVAITLSSGGELPGWRLLRGDGGLCLACQDEPA